MLSSKNRQKIFLECNENMLPSGEILTKFAPFSMLTYSTDQAVRQFNINFIPKDQILIMNSIIDLHRVNRILHINIHSMEVNGLIYVLLTNGILDENGLMTFFTYKFVDENNLSVNQWIPLLKSDGINYMFLTENQDFGNLTPYKLSTLNQDELDIIFANQPDDLKIGFAFLFHPIDVNPQLRVNEIVVNTDAKGIWNSTKLGEDYTYCYLDDSTLSITFNKPGKYKINYFG